MTKRGTASTFLWGRNSTKRTKSQGNIRPCLSPPAVNCAADAAVDADAAVAVGGCVGVQGVDCGRRQKTASAGSASRQYNKPVSLPPNQIQPADADYLPSLENQIM